MKKLLLILILCTSCSTYRGNAELGWQTMHLVDLGQTLNISARPDCYREANPVTATLIGKHPSKGEVVGVMVAYSVLHLGISKYLEHKVKDTQKPIWKFTEGMWHAVGLLTKGVTVIDNHNDGIRPFSEKCG